jgi:hypothetical protein
MKLTTHFRFPLSYGTGTITTSLTLRQTQDALAGIIETPDERLEREERRPTEWVRPSDNPVKPFDGEVDRDGFEMSCKGYQFIFVSRRADVEEAELAGTFDPIDTGTRIDIRASGRVDGILNFMRMLMAFGGLALFVIATRFHFIADAAMLYFLLVIGYQLHGFRRDFNEVAAQIAEHIRKTEERLNNRTGPTAIPDTVRPEVPR